MKLAIRQAGVEDVDTLAALNQVVQEIHVEAEPGQFRANTDMEEVKGFFVKLVSSTNNVFLIAEHGQAAVGYIFFERQEHPATPLTNARRRLYIHHIVVIQGARDQGVGAALLAASEAKAETLGIRQVAVDMWTFNKGAEAFFRAADFRPFQVVMRKEIGDSA